MKKLILLLTMVISASAFASFRLDSTQIANLMLEPAVKSCFKDLQKQSSGKLNITQVTQSDFADSSTYTFFGEVLGQNNQRITTFALEIYKGYKYPTGDYFVCRLLK